MRLELVKLRWCLMKGSFRCTNHEQKTHIYIYMFRRGVCFLNWTEQCQTIDKYFSGCTETNQLIGFVVYIYIYIYICMFSSLDAHERSDALRHVIERRKWRMSWVRRIEPTDRVCVPEINRLTITIPFCICCSLNGEVPELHTWWIYEKNIYACILRSFITKAQHVNKEFN